MADNTTLDKALLEKAARSIYSDMQAGSDMIGPDAPTATWDELKDWEQDSFRTAAESAITTYLAGLWRPIEESEEAKRGGREEVLGYREDAGVCLMKWAAAVEFMTEAEIESDGDGEWEHEDAWFATFLGHGDAVRLDGDEVPTDFIPLSALPVPEEKS